MNEKLKRVNWASNEGRLPAEKERKGKGRDSRIGKLIVKLTVFR